MGAPCLADLFQASSFALVCDSARGHKSNHAPSAPRRKRDGSPSRSNRKAIKTTTSCAPKNRWGTSSSLCSNNSPVMPQKPKVGDAPPSLKRLCRPPCTLQNALKPVRRQSIDSVADLCSRSSLAESSNGSAGDMKTVDFLAKVLNNLTLLDDAEDGIFDFSAASETSPTVSDCP